MVSDQTSEQAWIMMRKAIRDVGGGEEQIAAAMAQNVLHGDLGYYKDSLKSYSLDDATRDRLIAHARQDAAHAVYAALYSAKLVRGLRGWIYVLVALVAALLAIQCWTLLR